MKKLQQITQKLLVFLMTVALVLVSACRETTKTEEVTKESIPTTTTVTKNTITPDSTGTIAKNPAHGQVGHRCDIPVGAPLDAPKKNTTQSGSPILNNGTATPKVNPAHGQPGHRCDIPVGAALE